MSRHHGCLELRVQLMAFLNLLDSRRTMSVNRQLVCIGICGFAFLNSSNMQFRVLQTRLVCPHHRLLIHLHLRLHQPPDPPRDLRDLPPRCGRDLVVLAQVDGAADKGFQFCGRRRRFTGQVLQYPDVAIHPERDVHFTSAVAHTDHPHLPA